MKSSVTSEKSRITRTRIEKICCLALNLDQNSELYVCTLVLHLKKSRSLPLLSLLHRSAVKVKWHESMLKPITEDANFLIPQKALQPYFLLWSSLKNLSSNPQIISGSAKKQNPILFKSFSITEGSMSLRDWVKLKSLISSQMYVQKK